MTAFIMQDKVNSDDTTVNASTKVCVCVCVCVCLCVCLYVWMGGCMCVFE